jgi:hypothetical protein
MQKLASVMNRGISKSYDGIKSFGKLERLISALCLFIPLFLIISDKGPIRGSISEYYQMVNNQIYYYSLTTAAMLFIVNGVIKKQRAYNTILGLMLTGLILFNVGDSTIYIHSFFAIAFFGGNAIVIILFSSRKERWFKILMVSISLIAMFCCFVFNWFSLFWAEWLSFAIISLHYMLESWGVID